MKHFKKVGIISHPLPIENEIDTDEDVLDDSNSKTNTFEEMKLMVS